MFCDQCGQELREGQTFCGSCGKRAGGTSAPVFAGRLTRHRTLLGVLWVVWAAFWLVGAATLLVVTRITAGVFGRTRMLPRTVDLQSLPRTVMLLAAVVLLTMAVASAVAGWGLLQRRPWARIWSLVVGCLSLTTLPFGTALGIYTLWVLLPAESREDYLRLGS